MNYKDDIKGYISKLTAIISKLDIEEIDVAINAITDAYNRDATIYIFGNGGSAATASHFVCDFNKTISTRLTRKFRFICLNDNVPTIMAIANDISYEHIFSMQLQGRLTKDDLIIAISGSGNSSNVIRAVEYAKWIGTKVVGLTGYDGGMLKGLADYPMHVNIDDMQIIEDVHLVFNHMMVHVLCEAKVKTSLSPAVSMERPDYDRVAVFNQGTEVAAAYDPAEQQEKIR